MTAKPEKPSTAMEAKVARAIFKALKGAPGAYVSGHPDTNRKATIDGSFSLRYVAKRVLATVEAEMRRKA